MKAGEIYRSAMVILSETGWGGAPAGEYAEEYKPRALSFIAIGASLGYSLAGVRRVVPVPKIDESVPGDDFYLSAALPYFVAYNLVVDENPELYAHLREEFNTLAKLFQQGLRAEEHSIEDVYGGIGHGGGGRW